MPGVNKSTAILALAAAECQLFSETASEFVDLLHLQLHPALRAKKVNVFDFLVPT